jgi:hypothetical protein
MLGWTARKTMTNANNLLCDHFTILAAEFMGYRLRRCLPPNKHSWVQFVAGYACLQYLW